MMRMGVASGILMMSLLACTQVQAGLVECAVVEDRWRQTGETAPLADWIEIYQQAYYDSTCDGGVVEQIGLRIIGRELAPIQAAWLRGGSEGSPRRLLERLDRLREFGGHWRLSFLRGEMLRELSDVPGALEAYRDALVLVDDEELTPTAPEWQEVALLRNRLDEAALVAAQVSPSSLKLPLTRSGALVSQYGFETRGFRRQKVLVPIQFVYARDVMNEAGRVSFQDAFDALNAQGSPDITVIGHTDPVGSSEYNMQLSLDRANAVRSELIALNYVGNIEIVGKGEEEPFRFDDPGLYSVETRHQAHRRVELELQGN